MRKVNVLILAIALLMSGIVSGQQKMTKSQSSEKSANVALEEASSLEKDMKESWSKDDIRQKAEEQTAKLNNMVGGLSADQRQQVLDLNMDIYNQALDAKQSEVTAAEKREIASDLKRQRMEGYKSILTDDQMAELSGAASMDEKAEQLARRQTEQLHKIVNLTPDQQDQIFELNKSLYIKGRTAKAEGSTYEDRNERKKELQKERIQGYKNILSEDQIQAFIDYRNSN